MNTAADLSLPQTISEKPKGDKQVSTIKKTSEKTRWLVKRHHYSEYIFSNHLEPMTVFIVGHFVQVPLRRLLQ
ncbi:hypothetical protein [Pectobacterium parmentieri]|uniref:hypothetical protein n=1 Tax=Pectobacterium parmentieri TaxID=1905730 RepID=UPI0001B0C856|nr:hypothetical protein [Pectobacterium parmentieri]ACX89538.1 hypothetical protein Pecwa_3804 [Pectobacterium parmentieri WPP163]